jgi:hypothetical protein
MTTMAGILDTVPKNRKRPLETSTLAKTARKPFSNQSRKVLLVPIFDDMYNNKINTVDQGN